MVQLTFIGPADMHRLPLRPPLRPLSASSIGMLLTRQHTTPTTPTPSPRAAAFPGAPPRPHPPGPPRRRRRRTHPRANRPWSGRPGRRATMAARPALRWCRL